LSQSTANMRDHDAIRASVTMGASLRLWL
jgi:hypothetical protein